MGTTAPLRPPRTRPHTPGMSPLNAFVTPEYPVLFTVCPPGPEPRAWNREADPALEGSRAAAIPLALLVGGIPSFLCTLSVPRGELEGVTTSLRSGDARLAVVGLQDGELFPGAPPAAFVSLVCRDGRRVAITRVQGTDPEASPEALARHVTRQILRGVQLSDLAGS